MALGIISVLDKLTFWSTNHYAGLDPNNAGAPGSYRGLEVDVSAIQVQNAYSPVMWYYDRLDRVYTKYFAIGDPNNVRVSGFFDPLMLDSTEPTCGTNGVHTYVYASVGEWDRVANTQALYGGDTAGDVTFETVSTDPLPDGITVFPNLKTRSTNNGKSNTTDGYYNNGLGTWIFFETLGYAINTEANVRFGGVTLANVPIQVDLVTGDAIPIADMPSVYKTTPVNSYQAGSFDKQSLISFRGAQFVPDDDSTPAVPKGRLFFTTMATITDTSVISTPGESVIYVKLVEWNPQGAVGGDPSRVHKRELLFSKFKVVNEVAIASGGIGDLPGGAVMQHRTHKAFFHKPSNTIRVNYCSHINTETRDPLAAGRAAEVVVSVVPALSIITSPAALKDPRLGEVAEFSVNTLGDLDEKIAGQDIEWSLQRVSTIDEVLDVSGGVASTSTVANAPIDPDSLVVQREGVTLTLTTHYTVVEATGVITWVTPHAVDTDLYTASYRHVQTPASPPHGTLLTQFSVSDEDGAARGRVRYADIEALENSLDVITATTI